MAFASLSCLPGYTQVGFSYSGQHLLRSWIHTGWSQTWWSRRMLRNPMRSRCLAMCMLLVAARAVPLVLLDTSGLEIHGASCIVYCSLVSRIVISCFMCTGTWYALGCIVPGAQVLGVSIGLFLYLCCAGCKRSCSGAALLPIAMETWKWEICGLGHKHTNLRCAPSQILPFAGAPL